MTSQYSVIENLKYIAATAAVGLGLVVLFVKLDVLTALLSSLLGVATKVMPALFPFLVHAAIQLLPAYALDHLRFSSTALQTLATCGPLFHTIAASL